MIGVSSITGMTIPEIPQIGDDIMVAGSGIVKMQLQGILQLFPVEICIALSGYRGDGDLVADITYTTYRVGNNETYIIGAGFIISMSWIFGIAILAVPEMPDIGDDVVIAGGGIDKVYFKASGILFPFKFGIAFRRCCHRDFVAYIAYTTGVVRDDEAHIIGTGRIVGVIRIGAIA